MKKRSRGIARKGMLVALGMLALAVAVGVLLHRGRDSTDHASSEVAPSAAASLLAEIREFRVRASKLEPQQAAQRWFELHDRVVALGEIDENDFRVYDDQVFGIVGRQSLLAALPPPAAWPAFRAIANERKDLPLRYLAEIISGDRAAAAVTLSKIETKENRDAIVAARALLARIYGDAEERITALRAEIGISGDVGVVRIPDLVGMAGETRAAELLTAAIMSGRELRIEAGEDTQALARKVALANIERMKVAQWSLAESMDGAELFEAISKRFASRKQSEQPSYDSWSRRSAQTYYFLRMVKDGRQREAEAALLELSGERMVRVPHSAVDALERAHLNEPLFRFLDGQLARRPDLAAWDLYIEQAAYTGHGTDALALIDRQLARKDLAEAVRADLRVRRAAALLAADQVAAASAAYRELLAKPPSANEKGLVMRVDAAINAAGVGRLTGDAQLSEFGIAFALAALTLPQDEDSNDSLSDARFEIYSELRKQGRADEALNLALKHLERKPASFTEAVARRMGLQSDDDQKSLVEVAAIHSAAGRHDEVIKLLANSARWGAADLGEILSVVDSQRKPMGAIAALALRAQGDTRAAVRVARATVAALPGNDAGYEIIAAVDPDAVRTFDEVYSGDEYEERPLIWKASVQLASGSAADAEATIRQAIAVDPSDGEEGPNDRMRAYSVLAEILHGKGDDEGALLYGNAVEAIRISEHGDELHAKGLYLRAFQAYREALEKFSDAYCIQSRLAVQLSKQGRRREALEHYRRAYELMPSSFGRVESHCFGCESVFQGAESQSIANRVFSDIIRKTPGKPQAHYLLAYLREQQGRYPEALQSLRAAVSLDPHYLNAWKRLYGIGDKTYVESGERDIARLKLLELDPLQRHGYYDLAEVGQLAALWTGVERARAVAAKVEAPRSNVYPLAASAKVNAEAQKGVAPELQQLQNEILTQTKNRSPAATLYEHALLVNARSLLGLSDMGREGMRFVD